MRKFANVAYLLPTGHLYRLMSPAHFSCSVPTAVQGLDGFLLLSASAAFLRSFLWALIRVVPRPFLFIFAKRVVLSMQRDGLVPPFWVLSNAS